MVCIFPLFSFEHQQALVQEQLAKLAQREKEISAAAGLKDSSAAAIMERGRAHHEQEKAKMLVSDAVAVISLFD